jgi:hypothetical protein
MRERKRIARLLLTDVTVTRLPRLSSCTRTRGKYPAT